MRSCERVISITITLAVMGAWVAAARKAAIDTSASTRGSVMPPKRWPTQSATLAPMPAPIASEGVKMPPGMPAKYETTVAASLATPNHSVACGSPLIRPAACS